MEIDLQVGTILLNMKQAGERWKSLPAAAQSRPPVVHLRGSNQTKGFYQQSSKTLDRFKNNPEFQISYRVCQGFGLKKQNGYCRAEVGNFLGPRAISTFFWSRRATPYSQTRLESYIYTSKTNKTAQWTVLFQPMFKSQFWPLLKRVYFWKQFWQLAKKLAVLQVKQSKSLVLNVDRFVNQAYLPHAIYKYFINTLHTICK